VDISPNLFHPHFAPFLYPIAEGSRLRAVPRVSSLFLCCSKDFVLISFLYVANGPRELCSFVWLPAYIQPPPTHSLLFSGPIRVSPQVWPLDTFSFLPFSSLQFFFWLKPSLNGQAIISRHARFPRQFPPVLFFYKNGV